MKIFGKHFYLISSVRRIDREKLWELSRGIAHIHGNPLRAPLLRLIREKDQKGGDAHGNSQETDQENGWRKEELSG